MGRGKMKGKIRESIRTAGIIKFGVRAKAPPLHLLLARVAAGMGDVVEGPGPTEPVLEGREVLVDRRRLERHFPADHLKEERGCRNIAASSRVVGG